MTNFLSNLQEQINMKRSALVLMDTLQTLYRKSDRLAEDRIL